MAPRGGVALPAGASVAASTVKTLRHALGIRPVFKTVDTCAAEFEAATPYYYSTYETPYTQNGQPVVEDWFKVVVFYFLLVTTVRDEEGLRHVAVGFLAVGHSGDEEGGVVGRQFQPGMTGQVKEEMAAA